MAGVYNQTYFENHPDKAKSDGVLYCVVLVNQKTMKRECLKIGIASGKDWRHVKSVGGVSRGMRYGFKKHTTTRYIMYGN